jgi:O-antigen ligase
MKLNSIKGNQLNFFFYLLPLAYCIGQAAVSFIIVSFVILFFLHNKNVLFFYDDKIKILLILYFCSLILGSFFSLNIIQSLYSSLTLIRFFFFILAINLFAEIFKKNIQNKFFLWSFLLAFLIILDAYFQYFNPLKEDIFGFKADVGNAGRLTSIFGNELIVGSVLYYLFFTSLFFFIIFMSNKIKIYKSIKNIIIIFFIIFYLIAVFLSGDRMPFIMTIGTFLLIFFFLKNFKLNLFVALIIFVFFFTFQLKNNNYFFDRYNIFIKEVLPVEKKINDTVEKKNFFDSQWGAHFLTGYEIFKNNHYFGIGLKQFKVECSSNTYEKIDSDFRSGRCSSHPHNIYIEMLSETGIISTLIFLSLIIYFFIRCLKVLFNKKIKLYYNSYEYVIFVSFFVVNVFTFFPIRSSGSFFSNFAGSLIWYNFSFLFIYLKHFESNLKKTKDYLYLKAKV